MKKYNLTVLRFKFIPATYFDGAKFSIIQTNTTKRCTVYYNYSVSDTAEDILDKLGLDYSQIIDNTAKNSVDYVILSVDARTGIPDYIDMIRHMKRSREIQ